MFRNDSARERRTLAGGRKCSGEKPARASRKGEETDLYDPYKTKNGYARIFIIPVEQWRRLVEWMGSPPSISGPDFEKMAFRRKHPDIVVGANEPYAITDNSDYSAPEHATKRGLLQVEIEIRQDLIADPAGQAAWAERFDRVFKAALEVVDRG